MRIQLTARVETLHALGIMVHPIFGVDKARRATDSLYPRTLPCDQPQEQTMLPQSRQHCL